MRVRVRVRVCARVSVCEARDADGPFLSLSLHLLHFEPQRRRLDLCRSRTRAGGPSCLARTIGYLLGLRSRTLLLAELCLGSLVKTAGLRTHAR